MRPDACKRKWAVAINLVAFSSDVCFRRCGPFVDFGQEATAVGRFGVSGDGTCRWNLEFWAMIVMFSLRHLFRSRSERSNSLLSPLRAFGGACCCP